ncbi:MAG: hypothetical protein H6555_10145 [Lewinellaceae bacterium]|nr:hypothetical protein [Lewinellaceae bacterium]
MKTFFFSLLLVVGLSATQAHASTPLPASADTIQEAIELLANQLNVTTDVKECTFTIKSELEDGTKIETEVTVSDLSWWQCTKIQVGTWFSNTF